MDSFPLCLLLISINAATSGATIGDSLSAEPRQIPPVPIPSFTCQCGLTNQSARIYNGLQANPGEFPWQAGIQKKFDTVWEVACGAVIISSYYLLTAEHCFEKKLCSSYRIVAGVTDLSLPAKQQMVIRVVLYPRTHVMYSDDIALIKVMLPFKFGDMYPICLPPIGTTESFAGRNMTISGWGQINAAGKYPTGLRKAVVMGMNNTNCKKLMEPHPITPAMLCARGKSEPCTGDSGGPAAYKARGGTWFLAGIISWGTEDCGDLTDPTVFVRVTHYIDWIHNKTENSICTRPFNP